MNYRNVREALLFAWVGLALVGGVWAGAAIVNLWRAGYEGGTHAIGHLLWAVVEATAAYVALRHASALWQFRRAMHDGHVFVIHSEVRA